MPPFHSPGSNPWSDNYIGTLGPAGKISPRSGDTYALPPKPRTCAPQEHFASGVFSSWRAIHYVLRSPHLGIHARRGLHRVEYQIQSCRTMHAHITSSNVPRLDIPPTSELFSKDALVERHPNLLTCPRVQWALRNRATNGLSSVVYESKSGQLLIHEPQFLRWYLGLAGRSKPRASSVRRRSAGARSLEES